MARMHKVELLPDVVERVIKRRGRLHAYEHIDAATTALVVIDMQNVWVKEGEPAFTPCCQGIVPNINRLAAAVRHAGGQVYWVRAIYGGRASENWSAYLDFFSPEHMKAMCAALTEGAEGAALWHGMLRLPGEADRRSRGAGRLAFLGGGHRGLLILREPDARG